jgi:cytosine/adenosine deaminase-related metal-dependent hydrolase
MDVLTRFDALGRNTVIIHGIALRPQDMELMAGVGASVCWCPVSNLYLYEQTANVPALLEAGVNVTLGTDSSMTGGLNVLDEVRTGRDAYRDQTGEDPPSRWLVELMTVRAAYALMLDDRRGRIKQGYEADLTVVADRGLDPYTNLIEAGIADIALVIRDGVPIYGDSVFLSLFEQFAPAFVSLLVAGKHKFILGDLLGLLNRMAEKVGQRIEFPFLPCTTPDSGNNLA